MQRLAMLSLGAALVFVAGCRRPPKPLDAAAGSGHQAPADQDDQEASVQTPERLPEQGQAPLCDGNPCPPPKQCLSYYGIAGPSGPTFYACEIPCERGAETDGCPPDTRCVTIADGPGDVCRPG